MLRAMYPFKKTHPTSLSFNQGDIFVELAGAASDKNWHYVMSSTGEVGYVPKVRLFITFSSDQKSKKIREFKTTHQAPANGLSLFSRILARYCFCDGRTDTTCENNDHLFVGQFCNSST